MKKNVFFIIQMCLFFVTSTGLKAQNLKGGETILGLGVGYSNFSSYLYSSTQPSYEMPQLKASADYFVTKSYSLGVTGAYQSISGNGNVYTSYSQYTPFSETVNRFNVMLRSTAYLEKSGLPIFYGGISVGYEFYNYSFNPINPYNVTNGYYYDNGQQALTQPTLMIFLGARALITPTFNTFFELAGGTYFYAEIGLGFCLGSGKPETVASQPASGPVGAPPYVH